MSTATQEARREAFQFIQPKVNKLQIKVLKGILTFFKTNSCYPRYKQLAEFLNMDQITVSSRLVELRKKGYVNSIKNNKSKLRGTVSLLTEKGHRKLMEVNF